MISGNATRGLRYGALLLAGTGALSAQVAPPTDVPQVLRPPAGARLVLAVRASGVQIYACSPAADGKPAWTLKAPDAELRDTRGVIVGHHFAGPTWRYEDGSEISGKAAAHADSPDPEAVPWLLVNVVGHSGGHGLLSQVTAVQRLHTHGGAPPVVTTCGASNQGQEARIPYSADYYFYAPASREPQ